ncbi:MAG TPA: EAL domain-containing protein [Burkholderiales bacterium]|jgi:diguanylate cyclase (GGDEF)-like protein/PAS domain S-box-containing protein|nr:EAL domain-containing protein [Burkholderiales bacterium]
MAERADTGRREAARSLGPAIAIAAFCALLIAGVAALTQERISYERGDAVREATRLHSILARALEAHVLRGLHVATAPAAVAPDDLLSFAPGLDLGRSGLVEVTGLDGRVHARLAGGALSGASAQVDGALLSAAREKREGSLVSTNADGVSRYLSYRVLEGYPLLVAVGAGVEETLAQFRARERGYVRTAWLVTIGILLFAASLITAWVVLDRSDERFRQLAAHVPEAFWMTDLRRGRACYLSPAFRVISGLPPQSIEHAWEAWKTLIHPKDRVQALEAYTGSESGRPEVEHRILRPDGSLRWVRARSFTVRDASGAPYRIAGTLEDVTERRAAEEQLLHYAHYDALTDLPNRIVCQDRLGRALAQAQRKGWGMAVLFIDLDRFKLVNDMLGHAIGDAALRKAGERVARAVRAGDTVARIGGDEFAVVLAEIARPEDAGAVAQKILEAMSPPMELEGHEVFVSASVGIAAFPSDGTDSETLLRNADAAMMKAKEAGRASFQYYTAAMNERALEKIALENDLRRALEREEFELYYQPKQELKSGRIAGLEALLRWRHPERGMMSPAQFVPLLEDSGLIVKVGDWVVRAACRQIAAWQAAGVPLAPVAVNLAAKQFLHHDLIATIEGALEIGIDPALLALEITESDVMQRPEEVVAMLTKLKMRGLVVAVDDFGTGYSSLAYLKRLPVDALKLDRSFVTGLPEDADDVSIARAVIGMAHSLGLKVIAEGVETAAQRDFLARWDCDQLQGYLLSRALSADDCAAFLRARSAPAGTRERVA